MRYKLLNIGIEDNLTLRHEGGLNGLYTFRKLGKGGGVKYITYAYAYEKAMRCTQWLRERGYSDAIAPDKQNIGTAIGWLDYVNASIAIEQHYDIVGEVCDAMLVEQLRGLEGCKLHVELKEGGQDTFWLAAQGAACPIHVRSKARDYPVAFGKRICTPFADVKVLEKRHKDYKGYVSQ